MFLLIRSAFLRRMNQSHKLFHGIRYNTVSEWQKANGSYDSMIRHLTHRKNNFYVKINIAKNNKYMHVDLMQIIIKYMLDNDPSSCLNSNIHNA